MGQLTDRRARRVQTTAVLRSACFVGVSSSSSDSRRNAVDSMSAFHSFESFAGGPAFTFVVYIRQHHLKRTKRLAGADDLSPDMLSIEYCHNLNRLTYRELPLPHIRPASVRIQPVACSNMPPSQLMSSLITASTASRDGWSIYRGYVKIKRRNIPNASALESSEDNMSIQRASTECV